MDQSLVLQQEKKIASVPLPAIFSAFRAHWRLRSELESKVERMLTDGLLRPTVHKGLDRMPIYLDWDAATGERERPKYVKDMAY
jgi:hypothetical protein